MIHGAAVTRFAANARQVVRRRSIHPAARLTVADGVATDAVRVLVLANRFECFECVCVQRI
jgi:hypothetical protein